MQENNSACGHPEISGLAQAVFIAERFLGSFRFHRGFHFLHKIIELDTHIGQSEQNKRFSRARIIADQEEISSKIQSYIQELVIALRQKEVSLLDSPVAA